MNREDKINKCTKINEIKDEIKLLLYNEKELTEKKHLQLKKIKLALDSEELNKDVNGIVTL